MSPGAEKARSIPHHGIKILKHIQGEMQMHGTGRKNGILHRCKPCFRRACGEDELGIGIGSQEVLEQVERGDLDDRVVPHEPLVEVGAGVSPYARLAAPNGIICHSEMRNSVLEDIDDVIWLVTKHLEGYGQSQGAITTYLIVSVRRK